MCVHHDHIGGGGTLARGFGETRLTHRASRCARAFVTAHRHRLPRSIARHPVELSDVARCRGAGPLAEPLHLQLHHRGEFFHLQLPGVCGLHLTHALQTDVVAAAFEDRPVERYAEVLSEKRKVFAGELVLQCLRRCGNHHAFTSEHTGHEITHRFPRTRASGYYEVASGRERSVDRDRHFDLTEPVLGRG